MAAKSNSIKNYGMDNPIDLGPIRAEQEAYIKGRYVKMWGGCQGWRSENR
jgi:hypothetical protein